MTRALYILCAMLAATAVGSALAGCADDVTAIDFELVSDPNVNSTEQVAGAIDSVLVIVDSADGLYTPAEATRVGNVQIRNADANPDDLELVALIAVPTGRLPVIRLLQGGLPDVALDVRVTGVRGAEETVVALGHLGGARFEAARVTTSTVPFNIRPELLPPRVVDVLPRDGDLAQGCEVATLVVMFSKPMNALSLTAPGRILTEPGGMPTEVTVDSSGLVAVVAPAGLVGADMMSVGYRLTVSSEALDRDGLALDQLPMQDGAQGFAADFVLRCETRTMTPDQVACGTMGVPGPLPTYCPGGGRLGCVAGECVLASCEAAECATGFVCDATTFACTADCRPYGDDVCPTDRPACDAATGACH